MVQPKQNMARLELCYSALAWLLPNEMGNFVANVVEEGNGAGGQSPTDFGVSINPV